LDNSSLEDISDEPPGVWSRNSNFRLQLQAPEFLAPTPECSGPLKTENHYIICKTRLPYKLGCETGTQISGSGFSSTI